MKSPASVVVSMPAQIDMTNADQVRDQLLAALQSGAATVIVDLTETNYCDSTGCRSLTLAHRAGQVNGTEVRLAVVPGAAVARSLTLLELDRLVHVYPSTEAAELG